MLECGITYNDYNIKVGKNCIYRTSAVKGKRNVKYKVCPAYKEKFRAAVKEIENNTDYMSLDRYNKIVKLLWYCIQV